MIQHTPLEGSKSEIHRGGEGPEQQTAVETPVLRHRMDNARDELIRNYILVNSREQHLPLKSFMGEMEKQLIEYALLVSLGNQRRASRLLGTKPTCLSEKIKKYGIPKFQPGKGLTVSRLKEMLKALADCSEMY